MADSSGGTWAERPPNPSRLCTLDGRAPALLVEWRQYDHRWLARVVFMAYVEQEWVLVERWVASERLTGPK